MAKLFKRGDIWYFYICSGGRRMRKSTGSTNKALATRIMREVEAKVTLGKFDIETRDIPLAEFWDRIKDYSKTNHAYKSMQRYMAVRDHFNKFLASESSGRKIKMLSQISPDIIERYKTYRTKCETAPNGSRGAKTSRVGANAATINFEIGVLKSFFNLAIEWGFLIKNPTRGIKKLKEVHKKKPRFLDADECRRLLEACEGDLREIFFTFLNTGMRRGELENLEWADIDWKNKFLKIRAKLGWRPKTKERDIPLNSAMIALLEARRKRSGKKAGYVYGSRYGGRTGLDLRMKIVETAKIARIEGLTRVHDLRHTFASRLVMAGVDLPTVQQLLGHSRIETTMIYSHLTEDHVAKAIDKIDLDMRQTCPTTKSKPATH